uniref:twin-arginine translocation signal domain-containing protein n=1 Tax=Sutterella wadsworthensis TaxID=40545 RepID=UPI0026DAE477
MELNDILEKLSLPQDLTRRGFLKAASAAAALGHLNDACAKTPNSRRLAPGCPDLTQSRP